MKRRTHKGLRGPFPDAWGELLEDRLPWWTRLTEDERLRMEDLIRMFLTDKSFEGTRGFEPTEEMKLIITTQACLLILGLDYYLYRDVTSVIVSPSIFQHQGPRRLDGGVVTSDNAMLAGQAMLHGPVLIVWNQVSDQARHQSNGHNVVFHEFAHILDMRDGAADGVPPLSAELKRRWEPTLQAVLLRLRDGDEVDLDSYGATNPAELLAVATEAFFERPTSLQHSEPDLYLMLADFYHQDPAVRTIRG